MATESDFEGLPFSLSEFEEASQRPLTEAETDKALEFAKILRPVRVVFGATCITSFVRVPPNVGAGPHGNGDGVDFVPCSRNRDTMAAMHLFMRFFRRSTFGVAILEKDHIHLTLPGVQNRTGETLVEVGRDEAGGLQLRKGAILPGGIIGLGIVLGGAWALSRVFT